MNNSPGLGPSRRAIVTTGAACVLAVGTKRAEAQVTPDLYRERVSIFDQAQKLGFLGPAPAAAIRPGQNNSALDLAEIVNQALDRGFENTDARLLAERAGVLLSQISRNNRDSAELAFGAPVAAAASFTFDQVKSDYRKKFKAAAIRSPRAGEADFRPEITRAARLITMPKARARYESVATSTARAGKPSVPWYMIAAIHYREASLNFMGHLHNGDPLLMKTFDVPADRPADPWLPRGTDGSTIKDPDTLWRLSAIDALKDFRWPAADWTIEWMCYQFESYNGFGNRGHGVTSAYLWNWTQFYNSPPVSTAGGFPRDGFFSRDYVSKQGGVVAILLALAQAVPSDVPFKFEPV